MVGRKDGLMRFHKISPCPKCGGKVKAKWEEQHYLSALVFRCGGCRYKPYALALKSKPAVEWEWPKHSPSPPPSVVGMRCATGTSVIG